MALRSALSCQSWDFVNLPLLCQLSPSYLLSIEDGRGRWEGWCNLRDASPNCQLSLVLAATGFIALFPPHSWNLHVASEILTPTAVSWCLFTYFWVPVYRCLSCISDVSAQAGRWISSEIRIIARERASGLKNPPLQGSCHTEMLSTLMGMLGKTH